jgi:hypothetical protein
MPYARQAQSNPLWERLVRHARFFRQSFLNRHPVFHQLTRTLNRRQAHPVTFRQCSNRTHQFILTIQAALRAQGEPQRVLRAAI